jgi:hypothetical protein
VGLPVEDWIKSTHTGSTASCLLGTPKLNKVSLWTYRQRVWKPRNSESQDRWDINVDL